jgi:hypothetical protein
MSFAGKWMKLEFVMLSKIILIRKKTISCYLFSYVESRVKKKEGMWKQDYLGGSVGAGQEWTYV